MEQERLIRDAQELNGLFAGKEVILKDDEPTGAGFYGERGMRARVENISLNAKDECLTLRMSFGEFADHNANHEKSVWYIGDSGKTGTATETGNVEDRVEMGLTKDDLLSFIELAEPNPLYEAYSKHNTGQTYLGWLEELVSDFLWPKLDDDPSPEP